MERKRRETTRQFQPLRVPDKWTSEERRFANQLEELFIDIYRRWGRLNMGDLSEAVRELLADLLARVRENSDKLKDRVLLEAVIQAINASVESILIMPSKLDINGIQSKDESFSVGKDGKVKITAGKIGGFDISSERLSGKGIALRADGVAEIKNLWLETPLTTQEAANLHVDFAGTVRKTLNPIQIQHGSVSVNGLTRVEFAPVFGLPTITCTYTGAPGEWGPLQVVDKTIDGFSVMALDDLPDVRQVDWMAVWGGYNG